MGKTYQRLEWDSTFFGFPVASIIQSKLPIPVIRQTLEELREKGFRLVYWASLMDEDKIADELEAAGGIPVDRRVTLSKKLHRNGRSGEKENVLSGYLVEEYTLLTPTSELDALAVEAGRYSRFRMDPEIPEEKFRELYRLWMENSVKHRIARAVFVVKVRGRIAGMVTAGEKNGRGDIGLLAVHPDFKGKGIGTALVKKADDFFYQHGQSHSQVVTQKKNIPALDLYKKRGYVVESVENFYHFHL